MIAGVSTTALPHPHRRTYCAAAALLVLAIAAAYSNSLRAPFVYDDTLAIAENPTIRALWPLTDVLWPKVEGGVTTAGRPVLNLSFALNYAISGQSVWSYHVFNFCIHAGAALLLAGIGRRTARRLKVAEPRATALGLTAAALWALHPLQTQAVTYTVQRAESLMGFFQLLTLYGFVRGVDRSSAREGGGSHAGSPRNSARWFTLSIIACVLGMGTKEVMAVAPLLVLLYDRTFVAGTFREAWRVRGRLHLAFAATWIVLALLVASTGGNRGGTVGFGVGVPPWAYPLTQFQAIARYLVLTVWPEPLVFEYGTRWVQGTRDVLPYALLVLPLAVGTMIALGRNSAAGFLGAWFFGILAPTSLMPGTIQMIVEHRMYLSLAALAVGAAWLLHTQLTPRTAGVISVVAAVGLGALTFARNEDYRSPLRLWRDTLAKQPDNPAAHGGFAEALTGAGRAAEALQHRAEAVRLKPGEPTYHFNYAVALSNAGRVDDAIRHYRLALRLEPTEAKTHNNLAVALVQSGDPAAALPHYAEAARLRPNEPTFHYNHGVALARAGRHAEAVAHYDTALRLRPGYADARFNLGAALMRLDRREDALTHYTEALRLKPDDAEFRSAFAGALLLAGRTDEALAQFRAAHTARPELIETEFGLGNALAALKRPAEAIAHYESVLRRAPAHANAHFKLAGALLDTGKLDAAIRHYEMAIRLRPDDPEAHHNLGVAFARLERWAEARREFETALRLKPDYPDARRHLDQLRALLGR